MQRTIRMFLEKIQEEIDAQTNHLLLSHLSEAEMRNTIGNINGLQRAIEILDEVQKQEED
jgi:hypothetical protein